MKYQSLVVSVFWIASKDVKVYERFPHIQQKHIDVMKASNFLVKY